VSSDVFLRNKEEGRKKEGNHKKRKREMNERVKEKWMSRETLENK
jgi:hypothetical protein